MSRGSASVAETGERRFPCGRCGAKLSFEPGAGALKCPYCGFENAVASSEAPVQELDFRAALAKQAPEHETQERLTVKCDACGAEVQADPNQTALVCPFCGSNIVALARSTRQIKPRSLLPFRVTSRQADSEFARWLSGLWFAPGDLKRLASADGRMSGLYVPYWTYDSDATTDYTGARGDAFYVSVPYTTTQGGRPAVRTRTERRVRWTPASGRVLDRFDDVLVLASRSLPRECAERLEPWDLKGLVPYAEEYLSGFRAESYQLGLEEGFGEARRLMEPVIRASVCRDIGGDEQRIDGLRTRYAGVTFKHVLLPVWLNAYRYRSRVYRFLVNARTGEVQGERPWSAFKITLAVLLVLLAIGAIVLVASRD